MNIRILGAHNRETPTTKCLSILIDEILARFGHIPGVAAACQNVLDNLGYPVVLCASLFALLTSLLTIGQFLIENGFEDLGWWLWSGMMAVLFIYIALQCPPLPELSFSDLSIGMLGVVATLINNTIITKTNPIEYNLFII